MEYNGTGAFTVTGVTETNEKGMGRKNYAELR